MVPHPIRRLALACALAVCLATATARAESPATLPTTAPTTAPSTRPAADAAFRVDSRKAIEYLASEELEGRYIGSPGIDKAANYIADAFARMGLKPAPGMKDYFQEF